jgi:hypothetical protein
MPLSRLELESIETFRGYIEDSVAADERYGPAARQDSDDGAVLATRFEAGPSCWFELVLRPLIPEVRVGFLTGDQAVCGEIEQIVEDAGDTVEGLVASGFAEAGLDWPDPAVERENDDQEGFRFATPLDIEDLVDLDWEQTRNRTLRMLEGYLLALGPAVGVDEPDESDDIEEY